jgi:NitT/TauT family transport system ATP-binding protein
MSGTVLQIENLGKIYEKPEGTRINVLENINLTLNEKGKGFICSLLAPTGAGKSTLMKIISGIEPPSAGRIFFNSRNIYEEKIKIPYLPEKPSSFPWMSVKRNIDFAIKINEIKKKEIINAETLVETAGLTGYENHIPANKSYGFRFRIALARAIAVNSKLILIDDSLKGIKTETETKTELYRLLKNISSALNKIFILTTTDISEAILLSDIIFLMKKNPGFIFKKITSDPSQIDAESEKFTAIKKEIEKSFASQGTGNTITFSV